MPAVDLRIVVLAGGIGARFWPASTPTRPKPLLPLGDSDQPLLAETVHRALSLVQPEDLHVLTGKHLVAPFLGAVPELGRENMWIEPAARGTGPVLVWAAARIHRENPDAVMVSLHSDHVIDPESAFLDLVPKAAEVARRENLLVTIAVPPDRPEPGFGYIRTGDPLDAPDGIEAWKVGAFIEKPDVPTARTYVSNGYLWNSGVFLLPVSRFLEEVRRHAPEIGRHLALAEQGDDEAFFRAVPTISVDEAVLERSEHVGTVRATFRWDDVGSWEALSRTREPDESGNAMVGDARAVDCEGCVVWAEDGPVVLFGVEDLVVVRSGGVTLVCPRERASELKSLISGLPRRLADPKRGASQSSPSASPPGTGSPSEDER